MKFSNKPAVVMPEFKMAKIPAMFDSIRVINDSEELIFEDTFVTGVLPNNRVVKFKKSELVYTA